MTSPTKNSNPKHPIFSIENTNLSGYLVGLNSSLVQSAASYDLGKSRDLSGFIIFTVLCRVPHETTKNLCVGLDR